MYQVFVVSGGSGASGEQLVRTALAQFGQIDVALTVCGGMRRKKQVEEAVVRAAAVGGTIFHTLVKDTLRQHLISLAGKHQVVALDLMGPILSHLSSVLGKRSLGQPGLYRKMREEYFARIEAIEFAVAHDDGRNPQNLGRAQLVLVGVSRTGKTPLSMYLAMQGWKVANVPLVDDLPLPQELLAVDPGKVVALTINASQLVAHRHRRSRRLEMPDGNKYSAIRELRAEIDAALRLYRRKRFAVVDVTNKAIEETAHEIFELMRH